MAVRTTVIPALTALNSPTDPVPPGGGGGGGAGAADWYIQIPRGICNGANLDFFLDYIPASPPTGTPPEVPVLLTLNGLDQSPYVPRYTLEPGSNHIAMAIAPKADAEFIARYFPGDAAPPPVIPPSGIPPGPGPGGIPAPSVPWGGITLYITASYQGDAPPPAYYTASLWDIRTNSGVGGNTTNVPYLALGDIEFTPTYFSTTTRSYSLKIPSAPPPLSSPPLPVPPVPVLPPPGGVVTGVSALAFGAVGNGVADDTAALQAAINSVPAGGTITFPTGTYRLTGTLTFLPDRTYLGQPNAILHTATNDFAVTGSGSNITVDGLTFDGGGISISGNGIMLAHNTFQNIINSTPNWPAHNAIFSPYGLTNSAITFNTFANIYETAASMDDVETDFTAVGVYLQNCSDLYVTDNVFDYVYQGMAIEFQGAGPYPNVVLARNTFNRIHRMAIESQGANTYDYLIDSNYFTNWHNPWYNSFAISIAVDGGYRTRITNNYMSASPAAYTSTSQGIRYGYGIEIGGFNAVVTGNTVAGPWWAGVAVSHNAPNVSVTGNTFCNGGSAVIYEAAIPPGAVITPNTVVSVCGAAPPSVSGLPLTTPAGGTSGVTAGYQTGAYYDPLTGTSYPYDWTSVASLLASLSVTFYVWNSAHNGDARVSELRVYQVYLDVTVGLITTRYYPRTATVVPPGLYSGGTITNGGLAVDTGSGSDLTYAQLDFADSTFITGSFQPGFLVLDGFA